MGLGSDTVEPKRFEHHKKRIGSSAFRISFFLAPLTIVALGTWLLFNGIVCAGGDASGRELVMCRHAHLLPDAATVLILLDLGWLFFALNAFAEEALLRMRKPNEWRVPHYVRNAFHTYRAFDEHRETQRSLSFALEMSLWATSFIAAVLVLYFFEWTIPLRILGIAVMARILIASIRRGAIWFEQR